MEGERAGLQPTARSFLFWSSMMKMCDSGAHSLEVERMQQVIDKQERDIRALIENINLLESRNKQLESERGRL